MDELKSPDFCPHDEKEIRRQVASNGNRRFRLQCVSCGAGIGEWIPLKRAGLNPLDWDAVREAAGREIANVERRDKYDQETRQRSNDFWEKYNAYLQSPEWDLKRRRVLVRDDNWCKACLSRPATQVHHLTYAHLYNEPLFDLIAVCSTCHDKITQMDRERRAS